MPFMVPHFLHDIFSRIDEDGETRWIPSRHVCQDMKVLESREGHGVRLSANGYLDCTDWEIFDTADLAQIRGRELEEEGDDLCNTA
jgi:hypothetical protein